MPCNQRRAGAALSYVSLVVNAVVSFVYVPILLGSLTQAEYGVYELIGSVIAYLSVMDMGLSTTLSRFYARSQVAEKPWQTQNLLAMAAVVYGVITVLAVVASLVLNALVDPVFGGSFTSGEIELAHQMMGLVALNCAVVLPGNWFLAVITANERFVFARVLAITKYVVQVLVVVLVLQWHAGAFGVLAVQVAANAAAVAGYAWYCARRLRVRPRLWRWDWALFRSLFGFSFFVLLNMVFDQVFWKTGQVILGAVCGAGAVAVYGVACKVVTSAYMQVSTGVTGVFLPKLTSIAARTEGMAEINELFGRIGHIQAILVWGVCAAFAALGSAFIELWAGADFAEAYPATLVLMVGLSVALVQNLGISVLQAKNRMGFRAGVYTALAVLDVAVSIPVSARFGVMGCAAVAAVLLFVGTGPVMNAYYARAIGIDVAGFWKSVLPVLLPAAAAGLAAAGVMALLPGGPTWGGLALGALVFVAVYGAALWFGGFNDYEKGLVRGVVRRMRGR